MRARAVRRERPLIACQLSLHHLKGLAHRRLRSSHGGATEELLIAARQPPPRERLKLKMSEPSRFLAKLLQPLSQMHPLPFDQQVRSGRWSIQVHARALSCIDAEL